MTKEEMLLFLRESEKKAKIRKEEFDQIVEDLEKIEQKITNLF